MSSPHWSAGVQRRVLANGLTLLVQHVPDLPAVAVVTRVRAGFFDEPDHWAGISHVLEHMFFKGTPTRGVGEIARETKNAGGYLNAGTSYDYTTYYTVLPVSGLADAIDIQADALRNALLDTDELSREIVVIIEEAKRKLDTPSAVAQETLHALLFDHHRIRRWRIGSPEGLRALTREDLVAYYRSRYVPANTIVAISGGMDAEEAMALAERHYADWPSAVPAVDLSPAEPPRRLRRASTVRGDVQQSDLVLGWRGVPARHPDELALDLAAAILAAGRASRLYRGLRETGIAASVGAYNYSPTEVGVFAVSADLDPGRVDEAVRAIAGQVQGLREGGPSPLELERARTLLRARWARRFESADGRASELASAEFLGSVTLLDQEYARLLALTGDDVRDAVRRHLDPAAVSAVVYHPRDRGEELTAEQLGAMFDEAAPRRLPPVSGMAVSVPAPRAAAGTRIGGVRHVALAGTDLLVRQRLGTPTSLIGVYRRRTAFETLGEAGVGALAVRSALRGAGDLDAGGLAEAFERLGGTLVPSITADWFGFQSTVLSEHAAEAATLLRRVLETPRLDDAAVAVERTLLADDARQLRDDMLRFPIQLAFSAAYGDEGYGLPVLGTPESVTDLTGEAVRSWHRAMLSAGRTTVAVVGDLDPDRVQEAMAGVFDGTESFVAQVPLPAARLTPVSRPVTLLREREKAQTAIAMLFPGPGRLAADRHAAEIWAAIAGGLGGRLFEALRDRRSLAYTVLASPWQRRGTGALLTYIATSPDREEEARQAMLAELALFRDRAPEADEVTRAANYLVGQTEVSRQSAASLAGEMLDAWLHGAGLEELVDSAAPYRAVRPEDVQKVAARYLDPEARVEGVVRGGQRA
jgi:zinc protease